MTQRPPCTCITGQSLSYPVRWGRAPKKKVRHSRFFIRAYMNEWSSASKAEQVSMPSQPSNGEITIVIPNWVKISACMCRLWKKKRVYEPLGRSQGLESRCSNRVLEIWVRRDATQDTHLAHARRRYNKNVRPYPINPNIPSSALHVEKLWLHTVYRRVENLFLFPLVLGISED